MEDERAIRAARRKACGARGFLRHDHAIQAAADECKRERSRHDAEHGRRRKRQEPHSACGRNQIDQPEREYRDEPQKKQIAECILAKALGDPLCRCARAPRQVLAECTPCDREDDDRSDARADNSGRSTEHRAEKHSADYSQISSNRQRKRHNPDIKRDVACDRERLVRGNELPQLVVMPRERLKREPRCHPSAMITIETTAIPTSGARRRSGNCQWPGAMRDEDGSLSMFMKVTCRNPRQPRN